MTTTAPLTLISGYIYFFYQPTPLTGVFLIYFILDFEVIKYTEYSEILKGEALDVDFWPQMLH